MNAGSSRPGSFSRRLIKRLAAIFSTLAILWGSFPLLFQPTLFLSYGKSLPAWMILPDHLPENSWVFPYKDVLGRDWYRMMQVAFEYGAPSIAIDPSAFPDGCQIYWFSTDSNLLQISTSNTIDRLGAKGGYLGSEYPRQIIREDISAGTIQNGIRLGLIDQSRRSIYLRVEAAAVTTNAWHQAVDPPAPGRWWLMVFCVLVLLASASLLILYRNAGYFVYAAMVIVLAFWLAGVLFDRPFSGFGGQIDAGDDSYYLAYAQNLLTKGQFFKEPVRIHFGARHIQHLHGLPGSSLFLAPAAVADSVLAGKPLRREIDLHGLRAMRLLSAIFALMAMLFLGRAFHLLGCGSWSVVFPCLLMWGTSLPKWAFQRSIFTHSIEMALWCATLYFIAKIYCNSNRPAWSGVIMGSLVGFLFLVRGEYLLLAPLIPLVPLRAFRSVRGRYIFGYLGAVSVFVLVYWSWINNISTGYGRISSGQTQTLIESSFLSGLVMVGKNAFLLVQSYMENGGVIIWGCFALLLLLVICARQKSWTIKRFSIPAISVLVMVAFLSNAAFHTPLGMEWSHRYSLKLYPLVFFLFILLLQSVSGRIKASISILIVFLSLLSIALNVRSLLANIHAKDGGYWVWSDVQISLGGMSTPYGLYHLLGLVLFVLICLSALLMSKRIRVLHMGAVCCLLGMVVAGRVYAANIYKGKTAIEGLQASFYRGNNFGHLATVRRLTEFPVIAGGYGFKYPFWSIRNRQHTMLAQGWLYAPVSADYSFFVESKDGIIITINDDVLIDNWENRSWAGSGRRGQRYLNAGFHPIMVKLSVNSKKNDGAFRIKWAGGMIPLNSILAPPYLTIEKPAEVCGE